MQIKRIFNDIFNRPDPETKISETSAETDSALSLEELEEHLELLYAYIEAELDKKDAAALFPRVHSALAVSSEARIQYQELKEILVAERDGTLSIPTRVPNFDFSYLTETSPNAIGSRADQERDPFLKAWQLDEKSGLIDVLFSYQLLSEFEPLRNQTAAMKSHLKSKLEGAMLFSYVIDQQEEKDLVISFVASTTAHDTSHCNLAVTIDRPSLDGAPLLADSVIRLTCPTLPGARKEGHTDDTFQAEDPSGQQGQETIVQSTDPFGETIFRHIPIVDLPKLHFSIQPAPLM